MITRSYDTKYENDGPAFTGRKLDSVEGEAPILKWKLTGQAEIGLRRYSPGAGGNSSKYESCLLHSKTSAKRRFKEPHVFVSTMC